MIGKKTINKIIGKFGVELHGKGYLQSLAKGDFTKSAFDVQKDLIRKKKPVIFDIGANRGNTVEKYLNLFPYATVLAFEPFAESFNILINRIGSKARCFQKAVASSAGPKLFYVNKNVDTNSLLKPQKTGLSSDEQVKNVAVQSVECIILDEFCLEEGIENIDILKMDIQGGEYDALSGMKKLLSNAAIDIIYTEVYFMEQYEGQPLFHDISKLLSGYGYRLQDIYEPIYGQGSIAWADAVFVRPAS